MRMEVIRAEEEVNLAPLDNGAEVCFEINTCGINRLTICTALPQAILSHAV